MKNALVLAAFILSCALCGSRARASEASIFQFPLCNPGLEDGVGQSCWCLGCPQFNTSNGNPAHIDSTEHHSGSYSLRLTFNSEKAWQIVNVGRTIPADCQLTLKAWVKMPTAGSPTTKVLSFDLQGFGATDVVWWGTTSFPQFTGPYPDWTLLTMSFVTPTDAERILIHLHTQNGAGCDDICNQSLWIDDITLETGDCATPVLPTTWGNVKVLCR